MRHGISISLYAGTPLRLIVPAKPLKSIKLLQAFEKLTDLTAVNTTARNQPPAGFPGERGSVPPPL
jgi:hypothetical protein